MLTISSERIGDAVTLHCKGRIALGEETAILCVALGQKVPSLVLDLAEVDLIDTGGLGALVSLQAAGVYLKLMNPAKQVKEMLRLTRLDSIFELGDSQPLLAARDSIHAGAWRMHRPAFDGDLKPIEVAGS
jgi:anti-anti-sigma factor